MRTLVLISTFLFLGSATAKAEIIRCESQFTPSVLVLALTEDSGLLYRVTGDEYLHQKGDLSHAVLPSGDRSIGFSPKKPVINWELPDNSHRCYLNYGSAFRMRLSETSDGLRLSSRAIHLFMRNPNKDRSACVFPGHQVPLEVIYLCEKI